MAMTAEQSRVFQDPKTGLRILKLTDFTDWRAVHGYYDNCPWSPDGKQLAFTRMRSENAAEGEICIVDADGTNLRVLGVTRKVVPNDGAYAQWSADGRRVYYNDAEAGVSVARWVDLVSGATGAIAGRVRMVAPSGNRYAWHTECSAWTDDEVLHGKHEMGAFVQHFDTGGSKRLTTVAEALERHPRRDEIRDWHLYIKHTKWTPDGSRLLFVFTNEIRFAKKYGEVVPRVKDLYVVDADGSNLRYVGPFGNHPIWHPNGREILANSPWSGEQGLRLVLTNVETGERRLAVACVPGTGHPSFSPDGTRICVDAVAPGGLATLSLVDVARDRAETLLRVRVRDHTHAGTHLHPAWSRDGKQVLYASDAEGLSQLRVVDV